MLLSQNYMSVTTVANTGVLRQPSHAAGDISRGGSRGGGSGIGGNRMSRMYHSNMRPQTAVNLGMPGIQSQTINVVASKKHFGSKI